MARSGENIYFRKDNRWEGRYPVGRKKNGRLKYRSIYGKSYIEVKSALQIIKDQLPPILDKRSKNVTFQQWSTQFLKIRDKQIKESTLASYSYKIDHYLLPNFSSTFLEHITAKDIQESLERWKDYGLSTSSIKVVMRLLSSMLNQAFKQGLITKNPCLTIQLPKEGRNKVGALSQKQQALLEKNVELDSNNNSRAVILALHTGLRIGEIAALKWADIDFEDSLIHVKSTFQRIMVPNTNHTKLHYGTVKSIASQRIIPLSNKVKKLLLRLKKQTTSDYVFSVNNKPCEPRVLTYHFQRMKEKSNLLDIHFHQLRHTFATRCLEAKADIASLSSLLGHSSTQMTLDIYADSMLEQRVWIISSMENLIKA
ncbi:tyrosine-type recombinase/integrase [Enterococcus sp. AZ163]|uniref:tyrosine-type recombinase/integrase n=1 Tax=Enterococcus sp. AZ163 TaxID=2774638 RepID=UPI003D2E3944